jgi:hypothetical protein
LATSGFSSQIFVRTSSEKMEPESADSDSPLRGVGEGSDAFK